MVEDRAGRSLSRFPATAFTFTFMSAWKRRFIMLGNGNSWGRGKLEEAGVFGIHLLFFYSEFSLTGSS